MSISNVPHVTEEIDLNPGGLPDGKEFKYERVDTMKVDESGHATIVNVREDRGKEDPGMNFKDMRPVGLAPGTPLGVIGSVHSSRIDETVTDNLGPRVVRTDSYEGEGGSITGGSQIVRDRTDGYIETNKSVHGAAPHGGVVHSKTETRESVTGPSAGLGRTPTDEILHGGPGAVRSQTEERRSDGSVRNRKDEVSATEKKVSTSSSASGIARNQSDEFTVGESPKVERSHTEQHGSDGSVRSRTDEHKVSATGKEISSSSEKVVKPK